MMKKPLLITVMMLVLAVASGHGGASVAYLEDRARDISLPVDRRLDYFDSLVAVSEAAPAVGYLIEKGDVAASSNRSMALDAWSEALGRIGSADKSLSLAVRLRVARLYLRSGFPANASETAFEIILDEKADSLRWANVEAYAILAQAFNNCGSTGVADMMVDGAEREFAVLENSDASVVRKRQAADLLAVARGAVKLMSGDISGAMDQFDRVRGVSVDPAVKTSAVINIGNCYKQSGEFDKAGAYYRQAIAMAPSGSQQTGAMLNSIDLELARGDTGGARRLRDEYSATILAGRHFPSLPVFYLLSAEIDRRSGDLGSAIGNMRRAYAIRDSMTAVGNSVLLRRLHEDFANNIELRRERKAARGRIAAIVGLAVAASVALVIALALMMRQRRQKREHVRVAESLAERNAELSAMAVKMAQMSYTIDSIREISGSDDPDRQTKIKRLLRSQPAADALEPVRLYFENVNRRFFENLYRVCPELTGIEVRVAMLVFLNLSTKEIASLTNRSVHTITPPNRISGASLPSMVRQSRFYTAYRWQ